ncbi:MAG: cation diffusion facilitator family transporter [Chlamydiales bacterium]
MDHHDHHSCQFPSDHHHSRAVHTALWIAFFFMLLELAGGWFANSLALISDGLHLFTDVGAFILSLIALRIARWPSTPKMSYGYHRAEILGALASAISLWVLSGVLIYQAISRLFRPAEVEGMVVFIIATFGIVANLLMMRVLHGSQQHSLNVRAAYLHVLGDLLGSVGVIISGIVLWLTHWTPIDPLITILFACQILYTSSKLIKQTVNILMEGSPEGLNIDTLHKDLSSLPGVKEVHDLHAWAVSSTRAALSVHIVSDSPNKTLNDAHKLLEEKYKIQHMTLQIEDPSHFEPKYCYDCDNGRK